MAFDNTQDYIYTLHSILHSKINVVVVKLLISLFYNRNIILDHLGIDGIEQFNHMSL